MSEINVNLEPCTCGLADRAPTHPPTPHQSHCAAAPVLIPCPIPQRVEFQVALGECVCGGHVGRGPPAIMDRRSATCPARPIKVSCSISGKVWAESEVDDMECHRGMRHDHVCATEGLDVVLQVARDRWALVKALVLGFTRVTMGGVSRNHADVLFAQRDAVFAALAAMARAQQALEATLGDFETVMSGDATACLLGRRYAQEALARYVKRLVEQVGAL